MKIVDVPQLLERLGIETTRKGRELWACCPMPDHTEDTPSWRMRDEPGHERHGSFICYGCGQGGGPLRLVKEVLGLESYDIARKWLEDPTLAVDVELPGHALSIASMLAPFTPPAGVVFGAAPERWPTPARRYLEQRQIPWAQVERWHMGYAVDGKLAGRIVLPICDRAHRLVSYTARTYVGHERRYREPSEDEHADKEAVFGAEHWNPVQYPVVFVAEGAFDALALERAGAPNIAAVAGSQLGPGHISRLAAFRDVVVVSDPDEAGDRLADAFAFALGRWACVSRAHLPDGFDAAGLVEERGADALRAILGRWAVVGTPSVSSS